MADSIYLEDDDIELEGSQWTEEDFGASEARRINMSDLSTDTDDLGTWATDEYEDEEVGEVIDPRVITGEEVSTAESALEGMDTLQMGFGDYTIDTGIEVEPDTMAKWVGAGESMISSLQGIEQIAEEYTPIDQLFGFGKEQMQKNARYVRALGESEEYGTDVTIGQVGGYLVEPLGFLIPGGKAATAMKMAGRTAITAGSLGYVDYVDEEIDESRLVNTAAGVVLGGTLGYGLGKLTKKFTPKPMVEVAEVSDNIGVNSNAIEHVDNMDTFEELLAREMNTTSNPAEAMKNVQAKYPEAYAKGVDSKRAMGSTFDVESAKANLPLIDESARTGDPLDMIDLDYLGKHRAHNGVEQTILTIDERVRNLNPRVYKKLMDYETYLKVKPQKLKAMRDPFASYFETHTRRTMAQASPTGTFSEAEVNKLKYFTINGMFDEADEFIRAAKDDDAVKAFRKAVEVFETKGQELFDAKIIPKMEKNYWARVVLPDQRDEYLDALQEYLESEGRAGKTKVNAEIKDSLAKYNDHIEEVKKKLSEKNQVLSEYEESKLFSQWFMSDKSHITTNSGIMPRGLETVPEELAKYYADPIQSMDSWIHRMTKEEANINFLGRDAYKAGNSAISKAGVFDNTEAMKKFSSSKATSELLADMDGDARRELIGLMKLRLGDGLASPSMATKIYKGLVNSVLLGNPFSAFIQLGDVPRAAYNYGIKSAAKGLAKAIKNETGSKLTIEEMGLTRMAQEFEDVGDDLLIGKIQDALFTYSGFAKADKLGKETILNSALDNFAEAVKNPSSRAYKKFRRKYEPIWGASDFNQLVDDLAKYNAGGQVKENVSDNIQAMLITELSQAQPINVSSQTSYAAKSDYWKMFMTLKSFTLRQVNTVYRDMYKEFSKAARMNDKEAAAEGLTNLVKFVGFVGGGNLAVSEARDIIAGKKSFEDIANTSSGDAMVYALTAPSLHALKLFNIDGYAMDKMSRSGFIGGTLDVFAPPIPIVDDAIKLMNRQSVTAGDVSETVVKNIPFVGKPIQAIQRHIEQQENVAAFAEGGLVKAGEGAVKELEKQLGRPLTSTERLIAEEEGYSPSEYKDTKGVTTKGSGLTGEYIDKGFEVAVQEKIEKTRGLVDDFDELPEGLRDLMVSSVYRGGLSGSPAALKLINEGKYTAAAIEFLDNDEYRKAKEEGSGVAGRMERLATALKDYEQSDTAGMVAEEVSAPVAEITRDPNDPSIAVPKPIEDRSGKMPQFMDRIMNPKKYPQIQNEDGSFSSHLMAAEMDEAGVSYAFPMIVSMPDGRLKQFKDSREALAYNKSIGNVFEAPTIEDAIKFTETYKQLNPEFGKGKDSGGPIQKEEYKEEVLSFAKGGEVKKEKAAPQKLSPGVYQDEAGELFKVTKDGDIEEL